MILDTVRFFMILDDFGIPRNGLIDPWTFSYEQLKGLEGKPWVLDTHTRVCFKFPAKPIYMGNLKIGLKNDEPLIYGYHFLKNFGFCTKVQGISCDFTKRNLACNSRR